MNISYTTSAIDCSAIERTRERARGVRRALAAAAGLALASLATGVQAQELDAGRLELRQGGQRIGVESFRVWRAGSTLNAVANVEPPAGRPGKFQVGLQLNADRRPIRYERSVEGRREVEAVWSADRVRLHMISDEGERWRELPSRGPASVLGEGVAHHLLVLVLVLREEESGRAGVIMPTAGEGADARLGGETAEGVTIEGRSVAATRYDVRIGSTVYHVWLDAEDRLLRVRNETEGWEAIRLPARG